MKVSILGKPIKSWHLNKGSVGMPIRLEQQSRFVISLNVSTFQFLGYFSKFWQIIVFFANIWPFHRVWTHFWRFCKIFIFFGHFRTFIFSWTIFSTFQFLASFGQFRRIIVFFYNIWLEKNRLEQQSKFVDSTQHISLTVLIKSSSYCNNSYLSASKTNFLQFQQSRFVARPQLNCQFVKIV